MQERKDKILMIVFAVIAITTFVIFVHFFTESYSLVSDSTKTTGKIVEIIKSRGSGKNRTTPVFHPILQYTDASGKSYKFQSNQDVSAFYNPGDTIEIIYSNTNPQNAVINSFWAKWTNSFIFGFTSFLFGIVTAALFIKRNDPDYAQLPDNS